jgi:hypothetical protein
MFHQSISRLVFARRFVRQFSPRRLVGFFLIMTTTQTTYSEKLRDPRWQKKRLRVMQRDGFACRDCGESTKSLQVHHCFYAKGDPWLTEDRFLMTLCCDCHQDRSELEQDAKRALGMIFSQLPNNQDNRALLNFVTSLVKHTESKSLQVMSDDEIQYAIEFGQKFERQQKAANGMA